MQGVSIAEVLLGQGASGSNTGLLCQGVRAVEREGGSEREGDPSMVSRIWAR